MRFFLTIIALLLLVPGLARAQDSTHGLSLFGAPALDENFAHYPYVNPQAPKGGESVSYTHLTLPTNREV